MSSYYPTDYWTPEAWITEKRDHPDMSQAWVNLMLSSDITLRVYKSTVEQLEKQVASEIEENDKQRSAKPSRVPDMTPYVAPSAPKLQEARMMYRRALDERFSRAKANMKDPAEERRALIGGLLMIIGLLAAAYFFLR